jgi:nicotinate-nucleotide adenylyltransferase
VRDKVRHVDESVLEHASGKRIHLHEITQLDISSTKIRELARNNQSIRYLVPSAVERFVRKKRLYRG